MRRFLLTLWNTYSFFVTYANLDGFIPGAEADVPHAERPLLDRWLLAELNLCVDRVTRELEAFDATGAARAIEAFVADLSTWYVRRSRRRFWKSESDSDKLSAYQTLHEALLTVTGCWRPSRRSSPTRSTATWRGAPTRCTSRPGRTSTKRPSTVAWPRRWREPGASSKWAIVSATSPS